jgi:hypothetical protein
MDDVGCSHLNAASAAKGLNMELLNLLNPVYVLGNLIREIDSIVSAFDFSQPHNWLIVATAFCLVEAASPLLAWATEKIVALHKQ